MAQPGGSRQPFPCAVPPFPAKRWQAAATLQTKYAVSTIRHCAVLFCIGVPGEIDSLLFSAGHGMLQRGFESDLLRVETAHIDKRSICTPKGPKGISIRWDVQELLCPQSAIAVLRGYIPTHGAVCGAQLHHAGAL